MNLMPERQHGVPVKTAASRATSACSKLAGRTERTCERLETVELKDVRFQHLDP